MDELITVIVPIYNIENFIGNCIESIIRQSYENIEILLINDGSKDNSQKICETYVAKDSRVKLLNKENGGLSDARNYGLDYASGEYIVFIDGDDTIDPNYIEKLYTSIKMNGSEVAICSFNLVNEDYVPFKSEILNLPAGVVSGHDILSEVLTSYGYKYVVAWNKIYKKRIFDTLRFEKGKLYEDEFINYKLFWDIQNVAIVKEPLYNYVQRSGSIVTSNMTLEKLEMQKEVQKRRIKFYKKRDVYLFNKAKQQYCNWIINCIRDYRDIVTKTKMNELQLEFREVVKNITLPKEDQSIFIRCQNFLGTFDLRVASLIKSILR
ncbi:MAG: glycosyltransferase [Streptococcus orisratti]|uniref:glycosyltransferase family 2 protein n=1 Tax=Streptococcus orisratti TaxID=114652 RepID=UPI00235741B7|nr:glycosyltransferase [Streptococcus orisratti]MCI7678044.1 glycosyltransferase [Streptococcus orisratti]